MKDRRPPGNHPGNKNRSSTGRTGGKPASGSPGRSSVGGKKWPRDDRPANAEFRGDRPKRDGKPPAKSFGGKPRDDARRDGSRPAGPKPDSARRDEPRQDQPRRDQPRRDQPRRDAARRDEPRRDTPRRDTAGRDGPKRDQPKRDNPGRDKPGRDKSWRDGPRRDAPGRSSAQRDEARRNETRRNETTRGDAKRGDANRDARPPRRERPPFKGKVAPVAAVPEPKAPGLRLTPSLWGVHAVAAAWLNPARNIFAFAATETALGEFQETLAQGRALGLKRPTPILAERAALDRLVPPGTVHQGLILDAAPLAEVFVQDLAVRAAGAERAVILMLDQVTDPHNVGAVLRSASAFGAAGVIMQSRHAPEMTGVLAKTASGAAEHMPVAYETNLSRALAVLKEEGFTAIGLDERGEKKLSEIAIPEKAVLLLGAEGKGLRHNLREHCDILARLPTQGPVLSLNVSNAAAVALYALSADSP